MTPPRRPSATRAALAFFSTYVAALVLTSCGGGGGTVTPPKPPPQPLSITTTSLSDAINSQQFGQALLASGGTTPYTWSLSSGVLPSGLTLTSGGILTGIPTETATAEFTVEVRDAGSSTARRTFNLSVYDRLKMVEIGRLDATLNQPFAYTFEATGGKQPYIWTLASGELPPGLTLSPEGVISGTVTQHLEGQVYIVSPQVQDSGSSPQIDAHGIFIRVWEYLTILDNTIPFGVVTHQYSEKMKVAGGTPPYAWKLIAGALAPGLTLDGVTGEIAGIPTLHGPQFAFLLDVTDSSTPPQTKDAWIYHEVRPTVSISPTPPGDGAKDTYYDRHIEVTDGRPPYTFRMIAGTLAPGLAIEQIPNYVGLYRVVGTPTTLGTYTYRVEATDSSLPPDTATRDFTIRINEKLIITTTSLPEGWTEEPYNATLAATGGVPPYTYSVWPPLPEGLALGQMDGRITGIASLPYERTLTFRVLDSTEPKLAAETGLNFRIIGRLAITTSRLPAGRPNQPFQATIGLFGGTAPFTWSITSGSLPSGLGVETTGRITGTPTTEGTSNFTLQVTDAGPPVQTATKALSMTIKSNLGRNDSPATATPISNGTFRASISPFADPVAGPANPDHDYYELTAAPGAIVTVETTARRLVPASFLDTVAEIVDADGNRFGTCRTPEVPYANYDQPCLNDDIDLGVVQDSRLEFRAPTEGTLPVTLYVHVFSFNGSARPDYVYDLTVSGAN